MHKRVQPTKRKPKKPRLTHHQPGQPCSTTPAMADWIPLPLPVQLPELVHAAQGRSSKVPGSSLFPAVNDELCNSSHFLDTRGGIKWLKVGSATVEPWLSTPSLPQPPWASPTFVPWAAEKWKPKSWKPNCELLMVGTCWHHQGSPVLEMLMRLPE